MERISPGFALSLAWLVWKGSGAMVLSTLAACTLHELGHLAAALALGIPVKGFALTATGPRLTLLRRCPLWQEVTVLLAGPAVNLLLSPLLCRSPALRLTGAMGLLLGCFNLLPLPVLDGGQALQLLLESLFPGWGGWFAGQLMAALCCILLTAGGLFLALRGNPALLALSLWLDLSCASCRDVV